MTKERRCGPICLAFIRSIPASQGIARQPRITFCYPHFHPPVFGPVWLGIIRCHWPVRTVTNGDHPAWIDTLRNQVFFAGSYTLVR